MARGCVSRQGHQPDTTWRMGAPAGDGVETLCITEETIVENLSDAAYEILRDAVNVARDFQCQSVDSLKWRLRMRWPGKDKEIKEVINYWANTVRENHPYGVTRV